MKNPNRLVQIFVYKRHKFYSDIVYPEKAWVHIDPKGKEIPSGCFDESDAMDYVNNEYENCKS